MSASKVKAAKMKVYTATEAAAAGDGHIHVYVFDVFNKAFLPSRSFDTIEKATSFQRHEQERIYTEQEATPELFDLPFLSSDPDLIARVERDAAYKERLVRELTGDARARGRGR